MVGISASITESYEDTNEEEFTSELSYGFTDEKSAIAVFFFALSDKNNQVETEKGPLSESSSTVNRFDGTFALNLTWLGHYLFTLLQYTTTLMSPRHIASLQYRFNNNFPWCFIVELSLTLHLAVSPSKSIMSDPALVIQKITLLWFIV